jgi:hypothetical protein
LRTIIKTHRFELELRDLVRDGARGADEFIEATEWALARRAEIGSPLTTDKPPVWFLPVVDVSRISPLAVYYTFDDDCVILLSIQVTRQSQN